jgi:hypothetical protein
MKKILNMIHKENFRWNDIFIFPLIATLFFMEIGGLIGFIPLLVLYGFPPYDNGLVDAVSLYLPFIGIWIITLLFCLITKTNRPIFKAIGTQTKGNTPLMLLYGFLLGLFLNGTCAFAAWLHKDIFIYYDSFPVVELLLLLIVVFIQSSAEELICRGFLYQRLIRSYKSPWVAIIGNSLLFAFLHIFNEGFTFLAFLDIFVTGVLFSLIVYYYDSLWNVMALHAAWNYCQNIILGLPNSGAVSTFSIMKLDAANARDSFFYNVGFGVEGTYFSILVLVIASVVVYILGKKRNVEPTNIWSKNKSEENNGSTLQ